MTTLMTYRVDDVRHHGHDHMTCPTCGAELCDAGHDEICECRDTAQSTEHAVFYCDVCRDTFCRDWP